ncbi:MAG TPA: zf-HC2 domain-containing protein [Nocardioidaceae bacterium]|nr:zf-HC2 domain-containing protein [Nocardioidaceae bacterium]
MNHHLGDQVAAFVDGELDFARRERALAHLSECAGCRDAVEQQRSVKTRVQTLPGAEPSADLISALNRVPADPQPCGDPAPAHWHPPESPARRGGLLVAGVGSIAAGFIGMAYVVGGAGAAEETPVSPPVGQFSVEYAGTDQPMPFTDPALDVLPVIGTRTPAGGP